MYDSKDYSCYTVFTVHYVVICWSTMVCIFYLHCALQMSRRGVVKKPSSKCRARRCELDDRDGIHCSASTSKVQPSATRPSSSRSKAQGSLHLLKDLRKIQTSLRADDIVWDS